MDVDQFDIVFPSQTLDRLKLENTKLQQRQTKLLTIAAGSAILALIAYLHYLQIKKELKKNEVRIINPEDIR